MLTKKRVPHSIPLAIQGGAAALPDPPPPDLFHWPIVTAEDEEAVLGVLRAGTTSQITLTREFEARWGEFLGTPYNLAHCNGTAALVAALFGVGLQRGDELIVPSLTYWASAQGAFHFGATPVFADVQADTLCIDPSDIRRKITSRTRAIMVVHYCGHPADMDAIMEIAREHNLAVIEDVSHAQGSLYKGRPCGSIGDVAGISMMGTKSFAVGEGGMLSTSKRDIYERAVALCHYERAGTDIRAGALRDLVAPASAKTPLPLLSIKGRINQTCSAMGLVQLRHYPQRIREIQDAMNRFWEALDGVPGLRPHRVDGFPESTMGGWYNPLGHYVPEELGGLPVARFVEAVNAEGGRSGRGTNDPLHLHPVNHRADVFGDGRPTRIAFADRDVREKPGSLPVTERAIQRALGVPWFKKDNAVWIRKYAEAFRKVAENADQLLVELAPPVPEGCP